MELPQQYLKCDVSWMLATILEQMYKSVMQIPDPVMMMFSSQRFCSSSLAGDLLADSPGWQFLCPGIAAGCVMGRVTGDTRLASTSESAQCFLVF